MVILHSHATHRYLVHVRAQGLATPIALSDVMTMLFSVYTYFPFRMHISIAHLAVVAASTSARSIALRLKPIIKCSSAFRV